MLSGIWSVSMQMATGTTLHGISQNGPRSPIWNGRISGKADPCPTLRPFVGQEARIFGTCPGINGRTGKRRSSWPGARLKNSDPRWRVELLDGADVESSNARVA